jgi:APA family basic amino acid/polyamine antiporter
MSPAHQSELPRKLGLLDATTIVIGTMIGAGIFVIPSVIARDLPSTPVILAAWVLAGIASFFGALAYAELGAMLPHSGGQYVYLREAYGPLPAFLTGWTFFFVTQSGSIAAVSVACARFLSYLLPGVPGLLIWFPLLLILILTGINYVGVKQGARVQVLFTALKLTGLLALIVSAQVSPAPSVIDWTWPAQISSVSFGAALLGAFLAYDGWHVIAFIAGEVINPKRNIMLSLALGVGGAIVVYLAANLAYASVLPLDQIAASSRVAADTAERTMGRLGASFVTLTIVFSMIGAANGSLMTSPRIYFTQARDGLFFQRMAEIHPVYRTPGVSILVQGVWTCILTLSGSYEQLISYVVVIAWIVHGAVVLGLIVLRRKHPEWERPYEVWGYPWAPLLFVAFSAWFIVTTFIARPGTSLAGCGILLSGIPIYYLWRRRRIAP